MTIPVIKKHNHFKSGGILVASAVAVNFVNFVFNMYLGRALTFEQFALIALFNSFSYIVSVFFIALNATVNHRSAFLIAQYQERAGYDFLRSIRKKAYVVGAAMTALWIVAAPFINGFFHTGYNISLSFAPIILLGFITYANTGYLIGSFHFTAVAATLMTEVTTKLLVAWLLVGAGYPDWAFLSIPISAVIVFLLSVVMVRLKNQLPGPRKSYAFPRRFYTAAVVAGFASMAFLTFDVLLAKHFLSPRDAGQYALLALVGKMFYFFGVLPNMFLITLVSRDVGRGRSPNRTYYVLLSATVVFLVAAYTGLQIFGSYLLPLVFGAKAVAILPYLSTYAAAISLLVVSGSITSFHLAREQYLFPLVSIAVAAFMCIGLFLYHQNIHQFTQVILMAAIAGLAVIASLHVVEVSGILKLKKGL